MKEIKPLPGIKTEVSAPPSKAHTLRAIFIAAITSGTSKIINPLLGEDQRYAINALKQLGVKIEEKDHALEISGTTNLTQSNEEIFLGNSGVSVRFLATLAALVKGETIINGDKPMQTTRPIGDLTSALNKIGVKTSFLKSKDLLPLKITGPTLEGGETEIEGDKSSQYFSSIMISAPYSKNPITIKTLGEMSSKPYIDVTIEMMKLFGVKVENNNYKEFKIEQKPYTPIDYQVEGDFSNSSYFFGAAAIHGEIEVKNLQKKSNQGDKFFLDCLKQMGCEVEYKENSIKVTGPKKLKRIVVDMNNCPDIVPTLAVVSAFAEGESEFTNIAHLKYKECDRLNAVADELKKMGIETKTTEDSLIVKGGSPHGAEIETYKDHRIAMSFAMAGLKVKGMKIKNPDCVKKSFPHFWDELAKI